jgi:predicted metal-dependent hydrolase
MPRAPITNAPLLRPPELQARLGELYAAIDEFNNGWYFESHETLEDLWMVTPWPERQFMQGVIQLAAAFVHFARREYAGIFKLLDAALEKLAEFAPEAFGVDVGRLLVDVQRAREELEALGLDHFAEWDDEARLPRITYRRAA